VPVADHHPAPLLVPKSATQPVNCHRARRANRDIARRAGRSGGLGGLVELLDAGGQLEVALG
jgi:hypothetical protein